MTTAIYVRTSTSDKQDTTMQVNDLKAYAALHGHTIKHIYEDHGYTGTNLKRPALKLLLRELPKKQFDSIIIWKFDRLARSLKELLELIQLFDDSGVKFISFKDNVDLSTPLGRLMMQMIGAFGQFEAAMIRERVQSGVDNAKRNGTRSGRPFGAKRKYDYAQIKAAYAANPHIPQVAKRMGIPQSIVARVVRLP